MDPTAYKKTKAALGVQLAHEVHKEHDNESQATEDFVDVLLKGFAFRVHLYSTK